LLDIDQKGLIRAYNAYLADLTVEQKSLIIQILALGDCENHYRALDFSGFYQIIVEHDQYGPIHRAFKTKFDPQEKRSTPVKSARSVVTATAPRPKSRSSIGIQSFVMNHSGCRLNDPSSISIYEDLLISPRKSSNPNTDNSISVGVYNSQPTNSSKVYNVLDGSKVISRNFDRPLRDTKSPTWRYNQKFLN
jgi:hypothetical protein